MNGISYSVSWVSRLDSWRFQRPPLPVDTQTLKYPYWKKPCGQHSFKFSTPGYQKGYGNLPKPSYEL